VTDSRPDGAFESFVIRLTSRFTGLPSHQMNEAVHQALAELIAFLGTERATFVELQGDPPMVVTTFSQAVGEVTPFPEGAILDLPFMRDQIMAGRPVVYSRLPDDLPQEALEEREFSVRAGFRSNVTVPILISGRFSSAIASGTFRAYRAWTDSEVIRIRMVGQLIAGALSRQRTEARLQLLLTDRFGADNLSHQEAHPDHDFVGIVGRSLPLRQVLDQVSLVAGTDASVLLLGETGTGKELLANALHDRSARRSQPFVKVNCAAIPAALVESELFGHERGAFTGATATRIGRFELADGGTLLLDEVGDLPLETQAKLLRVLQDGRFERLGSTMTRHADVRIIAATNRSLEQAMRAGRFREDLYYRLSTFPIRVPSLRDRRDDIPLLVWSFIARRQPDLGRRITRISRATMHALQSYDWPGNVRELENVLERAMILTPGPELHTEEVLGPAAGPADQQLVSVERAHIATVLKQAEWRINGAGNAADLLGLHPNTLRSRMKKLGIKRPASGRKASRQSRGRSR